MSDTQTQTRTHVATIESPFGGLAFEGEVIGPPLGVTALEPHTSAPAQVWPPLSVPRRGSERNLKTVLDRGKVIGTVLGEKMYYEFPTKDGQSGRIISVTGPSIGCAMAAASTFGNCDVGALLVGETATHWTFQARFVDLESNYTVYRAFRQRKGQSLGMKDRDRQEDLVFQSGQSKAVRNVVVAALGWLCDEMANAGRKGIVARIGGKMDETRVWLKEWFAKRDVDLSRAERVVGRTAANWLAPDMAQLWAEAHSVIDGFASPDDLWPRLQPGERADLPPPDPPAPTAKAARPVPKRAAAPVPPDPKPEPDEGPPSDPNKPDHPHPDDADLNMPKEDTPPSTVLDEMVFQ